MRQLPLGDPLRHIRGRDAPEPVRLFWPAASTRKGPIPLIVFSHGLGGSRKGYSYLGEGWSARGTASLRIQHVGSDESLWQGNPLMLLDRLGGAADEREAIERTRDVSFGLDRLLQRDSPFHAAIDRKRIVAAGHSFGANTTLILTGAQVIRDGKPLGFRDPRFTASIVISAPPFYGETDLAAVLASVDVPTLHVTTTEDTIRIPGRYSPVQRQTPVFATRPDIVVTRDDRPVAILDTKWKRLMDEIDDRRWSVGQGDIYQMMAYAQVYGCRDLMLVYPHHAGLPAPAGRLADFGIVDRDGAGLTLLSLDLTALSTVRDQLRTALMRTACPAAAE